MYIYEPGSFIYTFVIFLIYFVETKEIKELDMHICTPNIYTIHTHTW